MRKYLVFILFLVFSSVASAQHSYKTAVGLRLAYGTGIDVKHNLGDGESSIEGIVNLQWRGVLITGLYEKNFPVFKAEEGFRFYMGAGAHVGFWSNYRRHPWYDEKDKRDHVALGIDGIIGLEYTLGDVPLNLAIDWIPMLNIADEAHFWGGGLGLSIRYAIK